MSFDEAPVTQVGQTGKVFLGGSPGPGADSVIAAWSFDPLAATSSATSTDGVLRLCAVNLLETRTISKVYFGVGTGASGATANQNFAGIYNHAGELVAQADIASKVSSGGVQFGTLTTPVRLTAGRYWVGLLTNASTTDPAFFKSAVTSLTMLTVGQSAENYRFATNGSSLTALPATIDPANNVTTNSIGYWVALG